jgi:hypothetical protein
MFNTISTATLMNATATNRNSFGRIQLPSIPDHIITKGQSSLSDEEWEDKIMEIVRKEVAAGKNSRGSDEWHRLRNDFMSSAAPDRASAITTTMNSLARKLEGTGVRSNSSSSFFQLLFQNSRLFGSRDIGANFIDFRDASGNVIANFSQLPGGGWGFLNISTPAEESRNREFMIMWDQAMAKAGTENLNANTVIDLKSNGIEVDIANLKAIGTPLNMEKLAAAGITLDPETGRTIVNMSSRGGIKKVSTRDGQEINRDQIRELLVGRYEQNLSNQ